MLISTTHIKFPRNRKCLPTMVNKAVDIRLSGLGGRDIVDGFQGRNYSPVVNKVEGCSPHFPVLLNQTPKSFSHFTNVECRHFLLNSGKNNVRDGIKNPLFNAIPGFKVDRFSQFANREPIGQFPDHFAGCNDFRGQSHRVRVNVLNDNVEGLPIRQGNNLSINRAGRFIKTKPNSPIQ